MSLEDTISRMMVELEELRGRVHDLERVERLYVPVWDDFIIQIGQSRLPASGAPSVVAYRGSEVLSFSKSATNTLPWAVQLPHGYKAGSDVEFHLHLAYPNAGTGNVRLQMTHSWANIGATFPAETTVAATVASPNEAHNHQIAEIASAITGTGKTLSSYVLGSLSRLGGDGADTYDDVVYVVGADMHILRDALGSRQETVK